MEWMLTLKSGSVSAFFHHFKHHIVVLCGKSQRMSKIFGGNIIKVLATLFQLSYTSLVVAVAYLQLTGSTTPLHRRVKYPWLVHFLSSMTILHDAILEIVREFGWTTVSVVFELSFSKIYS